MTVANHTPPFLRWLVVLVAIPIVGLWSPESLSASFEHPRGFLLLRHCQSSPDVQRRRDCAMETRSQNKLSWNDTKLLWEKLLIGGLPYPDVSFDSQCSTKPKIQAVEFIPVPPNMKSKDVREAILLSLGKTANPNWVMIAMMKNQWFFEKAEGEVVYAGFSVRTHYLQLAAHHDQDQITTIVCDSINLDQDDNSIHHNVEIWKQEFDEKLKSVLMRWPET